MRVSIKSVSKYVTTVKFKLYFGIRMKTDENGVNCIPKKLIISL